MRLIQLSQYSKKFKRVFKDYDSIASHRFSYR